MNFWYETAPSNIALIKYMGKTDPQNNVPCNSSLSYTLPHLFTGVTLILTDETQDRWQPLINDTTMDYELSPAGQQRFLAHLAFIKQQFNFKKNFIVKSANSFPSDCGLASSASSFAALTQCAVKALQALGAAPALEVEQIAALSRHGSGSSCRSFFEPWALWQGEQVSAAALPYPDLEHYVIITSQRSKAVSSSAAHQRVTTSLLFAERPQRAEQRLTELLNAFNTGDWQRAYTIVWQEFWDMHALFETAAQPFGYLLPHSLEALAYLRKFWEDHGDGPLVTMDAGANIHLLFRPEQQAAIAKICAELEYTFILL